MTVTVVPFRFARAVLRPAEIAARLHVSRTTVYRWLGSGELPSVEIAGTRYVTVAAYEGFVERREKRVTLAEQAARDIGEGPEVEGEVDVRAGLELHPRAAALPAEDVLGLRSATGVPPTRTAMLEEDAGQIEASRERLRTRLAHFENDYGLPSERVHREYLVEGHRIPTVPDAVADAWGHLYAAYASLAALRLGHR